MMVLWWPAIVSGLSGALAMVLTMTLLRWGGWTHQSWGSMLGTFFLPPSKEANRWGYLLHFLDGVLGGIVYSALFTLFHVPTGFYWVGLLFGIVHGGLGLLGFDVLRRVNPEIRRGRVRDPGLFDAAEGARGRLAIALGFVAFGLVDGAVYQAFRAFGGSEESLGLLWLVGLLALALSMVYGLTRGDRPAPTFTASTREQRDDET